jgi:O-acetylserine/cysteine efflux transporter
VKPAHMGLAVLVAAIWGLTFVVISIGLRDFPPLLMAALRFATVALAAVLLPRPPLSWGRLTAIGLTWFAGQFGLLFSGMAAGMPAGLASVTLQSQAFFSMFIAASVLGERPSQRQMTGGLAALAGLLVIGMSAGSGGVTLGGLMLTIAAAFFWATGNVLLRSAGKVDMLATVVWLSLVPPLPLLALSLLIEGPRADAAALISVSWTGIAAIAYIAGAATIIGFGSWAHLLKLYPVSTVAPFSLLVPVFGALAAALLLGERFQAIQLIGITLIAAGLAIATLPPQRRVRLAAASDVGAGISPAQAPEPTSVSL